MKKIILLVFMFIMTVIFSLHSDESEKKTAFKRTIAIMPYVNQNKISEYDFISFLLRDTLKSKLMDTNLFNLINFSDIDNLMKKTMNKNDFDDEDKSVKTGLTLKSDIVITGKYTIVGDQIQIITNAIDILGNKSIVVTVVKGQVGSGIFVLVEQTANEMSGKMAAEFPPIDKKILDQMMTDRYDKTILKKNDAVIKKEDDLTSDKASVDKNLYGKSLYSHNVAGIALLSSGSTLILAGSGILIYDFVGYMPIYRNLRDNASEGAEYEDYVRSYNTFIGLMSAGIVILSVGLVIDSVAIPLVIYKEKNRKLTMFIEPKIDFSIGVSYKF